jgi:hypothetical protein
LGDRDPVQRQVELAVAGAVEPMALLFARRGIKWSDAGELGQLRIGAEAIDAGDLGEELCRG